MQLLGVQASPYFLQVHAAALIGMSQPVLVIGAGFAGLSLARTLLAQRIPVRIFDSTPQLRKHSYGITLQSWAYKPLASILNLSSETDLRQRTATDSAVGGLGLINLSGTSPLSASLTAGQPECYRCSRSKLSSLLAQGVDIEFNSKLESIHSSSTGVHVCFEGGKTAEGILAVGADGVHSAGQFVSLVCGCKLECLPDLLPKMLSLVLAVRKSRLPGITPTVIPALAVNGSCSLATSDFHAGIGKHMGKSQVVIGTADRTAVTVSVSDHTPSEVRISWTLTWQPAEVNQYKSERHCTDDAKKIPLSFYSRLAEMGSLAEPFQSVLNLDSAKQTAKYNWLMRSVRIPQNDLLRTAEKSIVMIGDAAHAMPIVAGEGASHALLDGVQLGEALGNAVNSAPSQAVQRFYDAQQGRWETGTVFSEQCFSGLHKPSQQWMSLVNP